MVYITKTCFTWGCIMITAILLLANKASGAITITANPTFYKTGDNFSLRCDLGGEAGTIEDIYAISIGWTSGSENTIMAGMSENEVPQVVMSLKTRAKADGYLDHSNITESYLTMTMTKTTCIDARQYYCKMNIKSGILVLAREAKFNYTLAEGEPICVPPTTTTTTTTTPVAVTLTQPTNDSSTPSQSVLTISLYMMVVVLFQRSH